MDYGGYGGYGGHGGWGPYVPVHRRIANAQRELARRRKKGEPADPVRIEGRTIATSFWGSAWCENLERYADYANRLGRGRTYVRRGAVLHLDVAPGRVTAVVAGSTIYDVAVEVRAVPKARWKDLCRDCAGSVDSAVELLEGRLDGAVMERVCRTETGLFPSPTEIRFRCSCLDFAGLCKHVAATLYGVGARLDRKPELLFRLRKVSEADLVAGASRGLPRAASRAGGARVLPRADVAAVFGVEIDAEVASSEPRGRRARGRAAVAMDSPSAGARSRRDGAAKAHANLPHRAVAPPRERLASSSSRPVAAQEGPSRLARAVKASWDRYTPAERAERIRRMLAGRGLRPRLSRR